MTKFGTKLGLTYLTGMSTYGFYRGFNNKYKSDCIINAKTPLYIDRFISGLFSTGYYLNPISHPYLLYYTIKRTEKQLRDIQLTEDDWEY